MILLRSLQCYQARATYAVTSLSSSVTSCVLIATSTISSLTGMRWPFKAFASARSHCLPTVHCRFHVTRGHISLSDKSLSDVEALKGADKVKSVANATDSLSASDPSPYIKSDSDLQKTETRVPLDESKRELVVYVNDTFVTTKASDLYHTIRKMDTEQVCQFYCCFF